MAVDKGTGGSGPTSSPRTLEKIPYIIGSDSSWSSFSNFEDKRDEYIQKTRPIEERKEVKKDKNTPKKAKKGKDYRPPKHQGESTDSSSGIDSFLMKKDKSPKKQKKVSEETPTTYSPSDSRSTGSSSESRSDEKGRIDNRAFGEVGTYTGVRYTPTPSFTDSYQRDVKWQKKRERPVKNTCPYDFNLIRTMMIYYVNETPIFTYKDIALADEKWLKITVLVKNGNLVGLRYDYKTDLIMISEEIWDLKVQGDILAHFQESEAVSTSNFLARLIGHLDTLTPEERTAIIREYHTHFSGSDGTGELSLSPDELLAQGFLIGLVSYLVWYHLHENGYVPESPGFRFPCTYKSGKIITANMMYYLTVPIGAIGALISGPIGTLSRTVNSFINIWSYLFTPGAEYNLAKIATEIVTSMSLLVTNSLAEAHIITGKMKTNLYSIEQKIVKTILDIGEEQKDHHHQALQGLQQRHLDVTNDLTGQIDQMKRETTSYADTATLLGKQVREMMSTELDNLKSQVKENLSMFSKEFNMLLDQMNQNGYEIKNDLAEYARKIIGEMMKGYDSVSQTLKSQETQILATLADKVVTLTKMEQRLDNKIRHNNSQIEILQNLIKKASGVKNQATKDDLQKCLDRIGVLEALVVNMNRKNPDA